MLEVRDLEVYYGDARALAGVSIDVAPGEMVTLVGANGAGKSTTLRTISGLQKPRRGTITFDGVRLDQSPAHKIVDLGIAHVPENSRLFPQMTVLENLRLGAYRSAAWQKKADQLDLVFELFPRLAERRAQAAGTLSGGERQMCAIGRALMSRPRMLMLDEPSLGLAPNLVEQIFAIITRINRDQGVTVLLVEQNAYMALQAAHRGYVMETGTIVTSGRSEDLAGDPHIRQAYLGL
jgi:branched-chain amino acid transport system ATP-binding protein